MPLRIISKARKMIINKFGLILQRLTEEDIELVRRNRNSKFICDRMLIQKEITKEEQADWFCSINNNYNYYFLIIYKSKKIGLINGKDINYDDRTVESGIFIWEEDFRNTHIPILASLIMLDLAFFLFDLTTVYGTVRKDNLNALAYNQKLGYKEANRGDEKIKMFLTKANYTNNSKLLRNKIERIYRDKNILSWKDITIKKTIASPNV